MMWYFRLPAEEQQVDLPIGLKCARVLMDTWDSSVNLVPQVFVMNLQMEVHLHLVYRVIAMDMQISVMLRLVSAKFVFVQSNKIVNKEFVFLPFSNFA
jgi:hypothetical protein